MSQLGIKTPVYDSKMGPPRYLASFCDSWLWSVATNPRNRVRVRPDLGRAKGERYRNVFIDPSRPTGSAPIEPGRRGAATRGWLREGVCKIRPRYATGSSMDLSYIAHQSGYTRLNGPWYHLPALFLHKFKIRPRYATRSSMDLSYIAHQSGYTRLHGPWYHLPALFLHRFQSVTLLALGRAIDSR